MDDYRAVLKRVGIVLIVIGLMDIGQMIYCILHKISYSSSLNIFAVIAGIYLYRGSLNAARYVTWFSALLIAGAVGMLILGPITIPPELIWTYIKLYPGNIIASYGITLVFLAAIFWAYRQLTSEVVMEARGEKGLETGQGLSAFVLGGILVVALGAITLTLQHGEGGRAAVAKATTKYGLQYHYVVVGYSGSGSDWFYQLTAYNDHEIRDVSIELDKSE